MGKYKGKCYGFLMELNYFIKFILYMIYDLIWKVGNGNVKFKFKWCKKNYLNKFYNIKLNLINNCIIGFIVVGKY